MIKASDILCKFDEAIPYESLKRIEIRVEGRSTHVDAKVRKLGIDSHRVIGWFATKYNKAAGYVIFEPTQYEKEEFGKDCFRIYNANHDIGGIVTFNLKKGTVKFIDDEAYVEGEIKFLSAMPYSRLFIDNNSRSIKAFNVV